MSSPATTPMSRDQQFCLRWNNYQSNLIQVFNQLFQTESFVDVTLACEGHSVKAHRMVLSACSPYFQTVLLEAPCSHPVIILQGVKWSELKAIIEFIYKGEININQDQLGSLLRVAESLKIRGLADVGGEEAEAVLTSPTGSPRTNSQFWAGEEMPRKRRRLSDDPRSRSRSRSRSPRPSSLTPPSAAEVLDSLVDLQGGPLGPLSRGSSSASNPPPSLPSLPSPSPVSSLANSLSSFAHFHAPMPPPGPPLPPHLAHLPPLSPLSPLLNMHPMPRHHSPEDFEIRPGIAEMIREEERVSSLMNLQNPEKIGYNLAKLLESTHHWMANPMADSYQAQVQAAWQKSWNQTQSLLQNLRFRERGPLKSWRPETMADAIHAVLKEGLSLSQAARKYDIPYPTFVLYANRVHNLLGPSHEPGDMRPKGRGRPQRILLGSWPEDQIKGVIKAVVFRDTAVFRAGEHKENKKPPPPVPQIKEEPLGLVHGPFTPPNPSLTPGLPNGTSDKSGNSTPIPPSTPGTSQPLPPGSILPPIATSPLSGFLPSPSPIPKQEPRNMSPNGDMHAGGNSLPPSSSSSSTGGTPGPTNSAPGTPTTSTPVSSGISMGPHTPQSRPSSVSSNGNGPQQNGLSHSLSHSLANNNNNNNNVGSSLANKMNGSANPGAMSPTFFNGGIPLPPVSSLPQLSPQQIKLNQQSPPSQQQKHHQQESSPHLNHQQQSQLHNQQMSQRNPYSQVSHQLSNQQQHPRHQQTVLPPQLAGPQQMLGLLAGGLSPSALPNNPVHMARLFSEVPHLSPRGQLPMNAFHPGFGRHGHPGMQGMGIHGSLNAVGGSRMNSEEAEPSPEALLFGKIASAERLSYNQSGMDIGGRNMANASFESVVDPTPNSIDRPLMFRDGLDAIKSEPEAIMN